MSVNAVEQVVTDRYAICLYQSTFIPKAFNRY